jgi:hypothetical protein
MLRLANSPNLTGQPAGEQALLGPPVSRSPFGHEKQMKRISRTLFITTLGMLLCGCSTTARAATKDDIVAEIVKHAEAGDKEFFARYLDAPYKGQENQLVQQIKSSGMADNYKDHMKEVSETAARLDYHYLEKSCHFQIDLEKKDGSWSIRRIWFCR